MSLNGLDHAKVKETYEAAAAEPGGWFLLKYVSRDEVDLLGSGNGGVVEIRNVVAGYEEPSPLYGFLRYRRRNVIVRYMPENCSRLIQARATVHFNAVCERFAPYNTKFEISDAKDLKDSKLSAACSLHAASGSSCSSSSSLRRRRLNEIAEEEEEEERERKRQSLEKEDGSRRPVSSIYSEAPRSPMTSGPPVVLDPQQLTAPQGTRFASTNKVPNFTGTERPVSPSPSEISGRLSSQSARPGLYASATFSYGKPKVKLAPRPSVEGKKRPTTSANFRPIANLPAGFKFFAKSLKKGKSDGQDSSDKSSQNHLAIPQETPENLLPLRPATSSGASMKSVTPSMSPSTKESKMTPEKARLMKAMRMREKKMQGSPSVEAPGITNAPAVEKGVAATKELKKALHVERNDTYRSVSNADSGIAVDPPTPITINTEERSEGTVSDSHPPSPTGASVSEIGDSTKASSLSESTEETIRGIKDTGRDTEEEDGPEELSEIVEEAGLRMSVVETSPESVLEPTEKSHAETREAHVSDGEVTKAAEESREIPEPKEISVQTNEPAVEEPAIVAEKVPSNTPAQEPESESAAKEKEQPPKSPLGIPTSKFASSESKSPTSPTTPALESRFSRPDLKIVTESAPAVPAKDLSVEKPEQPKTEPVTVFNSEPRAPAPQISTRRKAAVDPIKTNLGKDAPRSSADPLDDDDLMEELQSATLHEAKPILVSKSPITPGLPNPTSNPPKEPNQVPRTPSSPMHGNFLIPSDMPQSPARSVASGGSAYLNHIGRQPSTAGMPSKKGNLGSGISQRIKALEKLSGSTGEEARARPTTPSSTIFIVRKGSVRDPSKSSLADRASTISAQTPPTPERSQGGTPEAPTNRGRERSSSVAKRLSMFEGSSAPRGRPESIQVTARIIRDAGQALKKTETSKKPTDASTLELKQSPLLVDVQAARPANLVPAPELLSMNGNTVQERRGSKEDGEKKARRRSSLSVMKELMKSASKSTDNLAAMSPGGSAKSPSRPPSSQQNGDNLARRLSISSYRSSVSRDRENATSTPLASPSVMSDSGSGDDDKGPGDKKAKHRASRFMRRLSNSFGSGRKSVGANISPTVAEEDPDQLATAPVAAKPQVSQPATVTFTDDVNVQFPDNLLWKRRSMCLDSQGFLVLTAVKSAAANVREKAGVKRYHMSDFRTPFIPDVEVQELPNSVVLELLEGSSLQVACENRVGQANILRTLQDAHRSYPASFGQ